MTVEQAFSCSFGDFSINKTQDITVALLSEACHNVRTEPPLQPSCGEQFCYRSANVEDGARLDMGAEIFWGRDKRMAFFDAKVFNPLATSYASSPLAQCYHQAELRMYDE